MVHRSSSATLFALRRLLLGILGIGLLGTATELLLIGHDEDARQLIPLAALAFALLAGVAWMRTPLAAGTWTTKMFRVTMVLLMLAGGAGTVLHYRANMEFKQEMDPSLGGVALFWSVIRAKAPPALAPGTLVLLGLIGLVSTFRLDPLPSRDS